MPEYFPSVDSETECFQNASCNRSIALRARGDVL